MLLTSKRQTSMVLAAVFVAVTVFSSGCEDDEGKYRKPGSGRARPGMSSIEAKKKIKEKGAGLVEAPISEGKLGSMVLPKLSETDFIEGAKHRDPFRAYIDVVVDQEEIKKIVQREIKLKEYDVAELKLIAIITNISDPRAMVVTPAKEGIVLRRGDYIGKADFVDPGAGGDKIQVNWRVARIHGTGKEEERGIYLVRDDPLTKTPEDITRFMPLHTN